ncbi:MAG: ABC transporter ATP-binding protein [Planctomycetota bacterium]
MAASPRGDGLCVESVSLSRGGRRILDSVGFGLGRGRLLAVVGPSGAGKSSLLAALAGFDPPDEGSVSFDGQDLAALDPSLRGIGMSFDDAALHEHLTVFENLESAVLARGEAADRRASRVKSIAESLGIEPLLRRRPSMLSAGERRRVAVGRVFIRAPRLALLDEPFANLDRTNRLVIRRLVRDLQRSSGTTTIVVTHDPTDAMAIADDMLVLVDGRVRAHGTAAAVFARPSDLETAQLVDDLGMHVVEHRPGAQEPGLLVAPAFDEHLAELQAAAGTQGTVLLGVRPWQVRSGAPRAPSVAIEARVLAVEPAGLFADAIAVRHDGRTLRARVSARAAQELPIGEVARFHVHEVDIHLFGGPWPGRRID